MHDLGMYDCLDLFMYWSAVGFSLTAGALFCWTVVGLIVYTTTTIIEWGTEKPKQ